MTSTRGSLTSTRPPRRARADYAIVVLWVRWASCSASGSVRSSLGGSMNSSFDRLAAIVQSSNDAILTKTPDGTITSWNRAATRIFGYEADEAIGRHITMLFPPERLGEEDEVLGRVARGERVEHFETQRIRKDGTRLDVSITLSPVRDAGGRIVEISKIVRDLTLRRQLERQAKAATDAVQTMEAFLDAAAEGVVIVNPAGHIVRVNAQAQRMFGY